MAKGNRNQNVHRPGRRSGGAENSRQRATATLPRGIADRLILAQTDHILPGRALLMLISGTALAKHLTQAVPSIDWNIFTCEHFYMNAVIDALSDEENGNATGGQIELFCTPDPPEGIFDTIIFPTDSKSSSELTRDLLQAADHRLSPTGRLIVATNNPKDQWLYEHLKATFGRITVVRDRQGICYIARKGSRANKQKDFRCEFAFRDGDRLVRCQSRPGVFSHRKMDAGARALIRSMDLLAEDPKFRKRPPRQIIEMGCGSGAVATAAALRFPDARVLAVDSHARAVQSTEETAALNQAGNVEVLLTSDGQVPGAGQFDLYLCNPPYFSDFRISEVFLQSASEALRPGGRIHLVTKLLDWHENRMIELFANAAAHPFGDYQVIVSRR